MRNDGVIPKPTEKWKHYKGTIYTVVGLARDCEDQSIQVVYMHGSKLWVRSLNSWTELLRDIPVNFVAGQPDYYSGPRFARVESEPEKNGCPGDV